MLLSSRKQLMLRTHVRTATWREHVACAALDPVVLHGVSGSPVMLMAGLEHVSCF